MASSRPVRKAPEKHLNLNVRGIDPSATVAINERSNALRQAGRQIFKLGLGQSPFPVPERVVQALQQHAHEKDYLPVRGLPALREAVAHHCARTTRVEGRDAEDVIIGPGSKELMFLLQLTYYGDLVVPAPSWVSYMPQARILGRTVRYVTTKEEDNWMITPEGLERVCKQDPSRPRLLILNYPSNPTGATFSKEQLDALAEVAHKYQVLVLSDEIYGEVHHTGEHHSIAPLYPEGTIVSSGLSKWCGAGGWRLGTFVFPKQLHWLLDAMAATASETYTSTSAPIQHAAISAFEGGPDIDRYLRHSRQVLRGLGTWCQQTLVDAGLRCSKPEGGFYLFANFEPIRKALEEKGMFCGRELTERILDETGVAILPGESFGRPEEELTTRIAYVDFDGAEALAAAANLAEDETPDEEFVRTHGGHVVTALDRLADWIRAS